jgi:hypothetical protein
LCRARGKNLAVAVLHAAQADRPEAERQRRRRAGDRRRELDVAHVDADALAKRQRFEVVAVGAQRLLRVRSMIAVLKEGARNVALGHHAQVVDRRSRAKIHFLPVRQRLEDACLECAQA